STDPLKLDMSPDGGISAEREKRELSSLEKEYFIKSLEFCREKGIELVPVKFPTRAWNEEWNDEVKEFMSSLGLTLLDIHDGSEMGLNWEKDSHDNGRHTNYYGNYKTSEYMSEYLKAHTELKDRSGEEGSAAVRWNSDEEAYRTWERENVLGRMEPMGQIYQYLGVLAKNTGDYLILIAGRKDVTEFSDSESDALFKLMGMEKGFDAVPHQSYMAVIDGGKLLMSYANDRRIEYEMNWKAENNEEFLLSLTSSGDAAGSACDIMINGEATAFGERGLNFLVLDRKDGLPLSRAYYGLDDDGRIVFRSENLSAEAGERMKASPVLFEGDYLLKNGEGAGTAVTIEDAGSGAVHIKSRENGKYLAPEKGGNREGDRVVFENTTGLAAADWIPVPGEKGGYGFFSLYNGYMLSTGSEDDLFTQTAYNGSPEQFFSLE
ncbi:MAG: RICIN domain-containing protein, partial [Lachnospiraceae bacterium]|nr:RICIN domain-containing protein [Lachnospiraceae bacterium]